MSGYAFVSLPKAQAATIGRWAEAHGNVQVEATERPTRVYIYYGHGRRKCVQVLRNGETRPVPLP